MIMTCLEIP